METEVYAGIDVGFVCTGVVLANFSKGQRPVIHEAYAIQTNPRNRKLGFRQADDDARRCQELARGLEQVLVPVQPYVVRGVVVELPHAGAKGARANRGMGMATGVVAAVLAHLELPTEWVTPQDVKMAAVGKPSGSKIEVAEAAGEKFTWPKDAWRTDGVSKFTALEREAIWDAAATLLAGSVAPNLPMKMAGLREV